MRLGEARPVRSTRHTEQRAQVVERRGSSGFATATVTRVVRRGNRQHAVLAREVDGRALDQVDRHQLGLDVAARTASRLRRARARAMAVSSAARIGQQARRRAVRRAPRATRSASLDAVCRDHAASHQNLAEVAPAPCSRLRGGGGRWRVRAAAAALRGRWRLRLGAAGAGFAALDHACRPPSGLAGAARHERADRRAAARGRAAAAVPSSSCQLPVFVEHVSSASMISATRPRVRE